MRFFSFWRKVPFSDSLARTYVENKLREPMELGASSYSLERVPFGTDDGIYKLSVEGRTTTLVRFMRPRRDLQSESYFANHQFLYSLGFPIPRIQFQDRSPETLRRYGFIVVAEQYIQGEAYNGFVREDPAVARKLAQLMARFHAVVRDEPGPIGSPSRKSYFDDLSDRIDHFHDKAIHAQLINRSEARAQRLWFGQWRENFEAVRSFNLVHGDFNYSNVIIQPSGEIAVIDFNTTHFGLFELDLQECNRSLFGDAEEARAIFFEEYFRITGPVAKERYGRNKSFFDAFVYLEKAASNASKARKVLQGEKQDKLPYQEKSERCLGELRRIINL